MNITRSQLVKKLAKKSDYKQEHITKVFRCLDEVILECFEEADMDNDVAVQILDGVKLKVTVLPERERIDPRTRSSIIVKETVKPSAKYSETFREKIQAQYESKKNG